MRQLLEKQLTDGQIASLRLATRRQLRRCFIDRRDAAEGER